MKANLNLDNAVDLHQICVKVYENPGYLMILKYEPDHGEAFLLKFLESLKIILISDESEICNFTRGFTEIELEKNNDAELTYRKILNKNPESVRGRFLELYNLIRLYELKKSIELAQTLKPLMDQFHGLTNLIGLSLLYTRKYDEAEKCFQKAITQFPNNPSYWNNLALIHSYHGKLNEAYQCYIKALEISPNDVVTLNNVGAFYTNNKESEKATEYLNRSKSIDPKHFGNYYWECINLMNQKRFNEAEIEIKKAIELKPLNMNNWIILGNLYREQGKFTEAETAYQKSLERNSDYHFGNFEYAILQFYQNQFLEAEKKFYKDTRIDPDFPNTWGWLGVTEIRLGKYHDAANHLSKALMMNPNIGGVWSEFDSIFRYYLKLDDYEPYYQKLSQIEPLKQKADILHKYILRKDEASKNGGVLLK